jgi:hypothetical protein
MVGAYRILERPERRRTLGRSKHRWKNNIKMDLQKVGLGGGAWNGFIWLRTGTGGGLL